MAMRILPALYSRRAQRRSNLIAGGLVAFVLCGPLALTILGGGRLAEKLLPRDCAYYASGSGRISTDRMGWSDRCVHLSEEEAARNEARFAQYMREERAKRDKLCDFIKTDANLSEYLDEFCRQSGEVFYTPQPTNQPD